MTANQDLAAKIDELVRKTEALADPKARTIATELLQAVMAFHAGALEQLMEIVCAKCGQAAIEALAVDDTVSSMLVLHGLHPEDVETRIGRAIEKLRMYFDSRGGKIALLDASPEGVRVRFTGHRPGSRSAAKQVIENAIYQAAPDLQDLIIEGVEEPHDP